jgi:serine/threonine protein kinase
MADEDVHENGPLKGSELLQVARPGIDCSGLCSSGTRIHCDLKPDNVILGHASGRMIDFGIAPALASTHRVEEVAGRFPFMAPEPGESRRDGNLLE